MPIIVSSGEENQIEVSIRYLDKGSKGIHIFEDKDSESEWIEKEKKRIGDKIMTFKASGDDVPADLKKDPKDEIKDLKTWWRRADWGTQSEIMKTANKDGDTDWTAYRMEQMKNLMISWSLKTADGEAIPINESILKRMDYQVALALIQKYENDTSPDEDESEDLD